MVGQNVSVFGVSQTSLIYFECELLLMPPKNGMCDIPTCLDQNLNRTRRSYDNDSSISVDVQTQRIEVSELGVISDVEAEASHSVELTCHEKTSYPVHEICVPFNPFVIFLAGMISVGYGFHRIHNRNDLAAAVPTLLDVGNEVLGNSPTSFNEKH
ncbi:unnamed protein product [Cylicostephanus goldi]|uniref:ZP domain-containing protein n=1 Tax=Cylicostephanus goldi TaxID=71465 RepID=A0A3P7N3L6_CYLGO|nr:unnamed protein product [Cylicostephanus goldi]